MAEYAVAELKTTGVITPLEKEYILKMVLEYLSSLEQLLPMRNAMKV